LYWNWKWIYRNWFIFGLWILIIQFVLQNLQKFNDSFLPQIPVGNILLFALGILILKHMSGIIKWWREYFNRYHETTNIILDVCGYLIILSVILSIPMEYSNLQLPIVSNPTKFNVPNIDKITISINNLSNMVNNISKETLSYINIDITPEQKNNSIEAFDYVNQLRKQNGRSAIQWDENIWKLAVLRSKDMYERNYFDHTTPEGKCVKDFQSLYGLSGYTIAENLGAQYIGYNDMKIDKKINIKEQVNGWMNSRGHKYNLMYPDHVKGAIGCYYGVCAFLGANTDPFGLGAGPCATGKQGIAFWNSIEKQPNEI
jgi:uncharacterized protein YkwD